MQNSDQERQDQRKTCNMEDSTMTIEFLRARLLSERSVSKSARQRADELARRVAELEEQLKIVSVQRRRAEKATADVLAILENNGVSDISEELDSSSDQDAPFKSNMDNASTKEKGSSANSKVRRKESEELSGSDLDISSASGRSLSWKGLKSASHSPEKYKDSFVKRRNSFTSMGFSSPKHRQGKSCRQIRRRESRIAAEELKSDNVRVDRRVNVPVSSPEVNTNHFESEPDILPMHSEFSENKSSMDNLHNALKDERNVTGCDLDFHGCEGEKNMEKALEHQAQLIGRYEAMERAQREWEEKFRENNNSTPDSCDPGNHSDVTEERDEVKIHAQYASGTASSQVQGAEGENLCFSGELPKTHSNDLVPPSQGDMNQLKDWRLSSSLSPESLNPGSPGQKFIMPMAMENHYQESVQCNQSTLDSSHQFARAHGSPGNPAMQLFSSDMGGSSSREPPENKSEQYALVPHETSSSRFSGVLDALKQARLSLQKKMNTLPLIEGSSGGKAIESLVSGREDGKRVEIPVGCSGLFRVPADFSVGASKMNFLGSGSQLSFAKYSPDAGVVATASNHLLSTSSMNTQSSWSTNYQQLTSDHFSSSPHMDARSGFFTVPTANASYGFRSADQILTGRYAETGPRMSRQKPSFDFLEPGVPSSSLPSCPAFPSYPDLVPQIHTQDGFPAFRTTKSVGVPPDQFSFYDNHFRPDTRRLSHDH